MIQFPKLESGIFVSTCVKQIANISVDHAHDHAKSNQDDHIHAISNIQKSQSCNSKSYQTEINNTHNLYQCSHASNIAWSIQIQLFECFLCTKGSIVWVISTFILQWVKVPSKYPTNYWLLRVSKMLQLDSLIVSAVYKKGKPAIQTTKAWGTYRCHQQDW